KNQYGPEEEPQRREQFEIFLRHAASISRERRFRLVLMTMTPNYWVPPPHWGSGDDPHARDVYVARFFRASGNYAAAEQALSALISRRDDPEAEFEIGCLRRLACRCAEARDHLERALEETMTTRATSATNALIRRVAVEERVLIRDTLRAAEADASDGIPGWETVSDHCHLLRPVFAREARAILALL